jgi:hypothetical protein
MPPLARSRTKLLKQVLGLAHATDNDHENVDIKSIVQPTKVGTRSTRLAQKTRAESSISELSSEELELLEKDVDGTKRQPMKLKIPSTTKVTSVDEDFDHSPVSESDHDDPLSVSDTENTARPLNGKISAKQLKVPAATYKSTGANGKTRKRLSGPLEKEGDDDSKIAMWSMSDKPAPKKSSKPKFGQTYGKVKPESKRPLPDTKQGNYHVAHVLC